MAPLPLFKLAALLAKQISKPLARIIKEKTVNHHFFKTRFVLPVAQGKSKFFLVLKSIIINNRSS